jgi:hypothetical protein
MNLQVQDIIKDAMGLIGATEMDETPSASEMLTGMRIANIMLGRWGGQKYMLRSPKQLTIPITAGKSNYTIGLSGCDVTDSKPITVESAFLRDSSNLDTPLEVVTLGILESQTDRLITQSESSILTYDPGNTQQAIQVGTIHLYPTPDENYTLYVRVQSQLTEFSALTDEVTMEPMYYEALIYNLAVRLFRRFHTKGEVPGDVVSIANNSIRNLHTTNSSRTQSQMDLVAGGGYNVYTDE